jgi:integrase
MQERPGQIGDYWLSKRPGSEQWCRTWYDTRTRQTRRASLGTVDFQQGKLKLWEWFAEFGRLGKQAPTETPLAQVLVRYWEQHAKTLASAEMIKVSLRYWTEHFGAAMVSEITKHRQREFVKWLHASGKKPRSDGYIKRILTDGKSALNWAWKEGEIESVPFILPGVDSPARERVLTVEESSALWSAARRPHEVMMLALLYCTLARPEAALELRREFVDFDRRLLNQNPPGRRQTKKHRPTVPVCATLLTTLQGAPEGPLVTWRGQPIASFKTAWRKLRKDAGLGQDVVPKTIRHTMATELRAAGVPEAEIQGFLGHRAFGGKTEVYAKYRPDYLGEATAAIDAYVGRVRASCVLVTPYDNLQSNVSI